MIGLSQSQNADTIDSSKHNVRGAHPGSDHHGKKIPAAANIRCKEGPGSPPGRYSRTGIFGIQSQLRLSRLHYRACVPVGPFRFTTRYTDLDRACQHLEILLAIRARTTADANAEHNPVFDVNEDRLGVSILEELRVRGLSAVELRMRFHAIVPTKRWLGTALATPCFAITDENGLKRGLSAWRRLCEAQQRLREGNSLYATHCLQSVTMWEKLRQTYVDIWAEAGRCPSRTFDRLHALESKHKRRPRGLPGVEGAYRSLPFCDSSGYCLGKVGPERSLSLAVLRETPTTESQRRRAHVEARIHRLLQRWTTQRAMSAASSVKRRKLVTAR